MQGRSRNVLRHPENPVHIAQNRLCGLAFRAAAVRAVRMGACSLYHACAHNMLHEKSPEVLGALLKSAVFTVQAKHYCACGAYIRQHRALLEAVSGADLCIVESALAAKAGDAPDFDRTSDLLFCWAGELIRQSPAE